VVNTLTSNPRDSVIGLGLVVMGLPIYFLWVKRPQRLPDESYIRHPEP